MSSRAARTRLREHEEVKWKAWLSSFNEAERLSEIGTTRQVEHHNKCGYLSLRDKLADKEPIHKFIAEVKEVGDICVDEYERTGKSYFEHFGAENFSVEKVHEEIKAHCDVPLKMGVSFKRDQWAKVGFFRAAAKKYKRTIFVYVKSGEGVTTRGSVSFSDKLDNLTINTNIFYYEEESGCVFSVFTDGKILFPTNDAVCIECNVRSHQFNPMNLHHNCTRSPNPSRLMSGDEAEKVAEAGEEGAGDTATETHTLKDPPENLVMAATLDLGKEEEGKEEEGKEEEGKEEEGKEEENMVDVAAEETKAEENAAFTLISLHSAESPDVSTGSAFPEALYKRFLQDENCLTEEEKKLLVSGLNDRCSEYRTALTKLDKRTQQALYERFLQDENCLTEEEKKLLVSGLKDRCSEYRTALTKLDNRTQNVRPCAWAPFCKKLAHECGGWIKNKCKDRETLQLPENYEDEMEQFRKNRAKIAFDLHLSKRKEAKAGEEGLNRELKRELVKTKEKLKKVKREKKELEEKLGGKVRKNVR